MYDMSILGWALGVLIVLGLVWLLRGGSKEKTKTKTTVARRARPASSSTPEWKTVTASAPLTPTAPAEARGPAPPALAAFTLLQSETLPDTTLADLAPLASSLGQPHPILGRLSSGLDDVESLAEIVRSDPGLSAEVLRRVNSSAFGLSAPIASVQYALTFLGTNFVRQVVLHASVAPSVPLETTEQQAAADRLWQASYIASSYAQLAAQHHGLARPSVLSTQVLLACLGDVVVVAARPDLASSYLESSSLFERTDQQQIALGANAGQLAAWLAQRWQLPEELIQSLRISLLPMTVPPDRHPLTGEARRANLLTYTACIVGQRVVRDRVTDLGNLDLTTDTGLDCHYLPDHLDVSGLKGLLGFHQGPAVRQKLKALINTLLG